MSEPIEGRIVHRATRDEQEVEWAAQGMVESTSGRDWSDLPMGLRRALVAWLREYEAWEHAHPSEFMRGTTDPWLDHYRTSAMFANDFDALTHVAGWDDKGPVTGKPEPTPPPPTAAEQAAADRRRYPFVYMAMEGDDEDARRMAERFVQPDVWAHNHEAFLREESRGREWWDYEFDHEILTGHKPSPGCCPGTLSGGTL